jgi:hypothetical protein
MNDLTPERLPADFAGFDEEQLPEVLPGDFTDFDEEEPEELPADFAGSEDRSPGPSASQAPSPCAPQSSTASPASVASSPLLEPLLPEERDIVIAFAQTLGATVTHVVPRCVRDPVFPRDAPRDWDTWQRRRNDGIFARAGAAGREASGNKRLYEFLYELEQERKEEEKRKRQGRKTWLDHQRQIGRGWGKYLYWLECAPQKAQAYRQEHEDADGQWLIEMADNRSFKRRPKVTMPAKPKSLKPRFSRRARGMGS